LVGGIVAVWLCFGNLFPSNLHCLLRLLLPLGSLDVYGLSIAFIALCGKEEGGISQRVDGCRKVKDKKAKTKTKDDDDLPFAPKA
jgi:hypothetical protein